MRWAIVMALATCAACGGKKSAEKTAPVVAAPPEPVSVDDLLALREPLERAATAWLAEDLAGGAPIVIAEGPPHVRAAAKTAAAAGVKLLVVDAAYYVSSAAGDGGAAIGLFES